MKKLIYIFLICLIGKNVHAQFAFGFPENTTCWDGSTLVQAYPDWYAYQTLDDSYDGTIDSTVCINLGLGSYYANLQANEFDVTKPVFLRWHNDEGYHLEPNQLYYLGNYNSFDGLNTGVTDCVDDICNGLIVQIRVSDNPGDNDTLPEYRMHKQEFVVNDMGEVAVCIPTENFEIGSELTDIIFKMNLNPIQGNQLVYEPFIYQIWIYDLLNESSILNYLQDQFNYYFYGYQNYIVPYTMASFPSVDSISYLDVQPVPNIAQQAVVNFELAEYSALMFQPFTQLRAGLVEGQTELRHYLNVMNDGTICFNFFMEMVMPPGGVYTHRKGHIESSWGSCMRFQPASTLRVSSHSRLDFGNKGMGMLATQSGALIELDEQASLYIDCPWRIFNEPWQLEPESIHIHLQSGQALVFGPYASLENYSTDEQMKLIVHMEGGYLDVAPLSDEELAHIDVVYDETEQHLEWLRMETWVEDGLLEGALRTHASRPLEWSVFNLSGQRVASGTAIGQDDYMQFELATATWPSGMYILEARQGLEHVQIKIVIP